MKVKTVTSASFVLATDAHKTWPTFDNTRLVAYNTCPVWGTVRYGHHKVMTAKENVPGESRAMALEQGSVMHEVFAWVRMCQLWTQLEDKALANELFTRVGNALFTENRLQIILQNINASIADDLLVYCKQGASNVLETSGYYDNPNDRRRTLANMELAAYAYVDKWNWKNNIWLSEQSVNAYVGIEMPFDIAVEIEYTTEDGAQRVLQCRFTGRIDGMHFRDGDPTVLHLGENKTASRLDDAWSMSFSMATQVTGYCIAASVLTKHQVDRAFIFGLAIPLPKGYDYGGVISQRVLRKHHHFDQWTKWFTNTAVNALSDMDDPLNAVRYTHSCSRYFRPCPLIFLCDNPIEEQQRIFDDMPTDEWSPLDKPGANT